MSVDGTALRDLKGVHAPCIQDHMLVEVKSLPQVSKTARNFFNTCLPNVPCPGEEFDFYNKEVATLAEQVKNLEGLQNRHQDDLAVEHMARALAVIFTTLSIAFFVSGIVSAVLSITAPLSALGIVFGLMLTTISIFCLAEAFDGRIQGHEFNGEKSQIALQKKKIELCKWLVRSMLPQFVAYFKEHGATLQKKCKDRLDALTDSLESSKPLRAGYEANTDSLKKEIEQLQKLEKDLASARAMVDSLPKTIATLEMRLNEIIADCEEGIEENEKRPVPGDVSHLTTRKKASHTALATLRQKEPYLPLERKVPQLCEQLQGVAL